MVSTIKKFEHGELDIIREMLHNEAQDGKHIFFEVKVDHLTRIHRTSRLERFDDIYKFINPDTSLLTIMLYPDPAKPGKWEAYKFTFENEKTDVNGMDGVEAIVNQRMEVYERKFEAQKAEDKIKQLEEKLEEAHEYIAMVEQANAVLKEKAEPYDKLGMALGMTFSGITAVYPEVANSRMARGISGLLKGSPTPQQQTPEKSFEGEVTFAEKKESSAEESQHEVMVRKLTVFMTENFDKEQRVLLSLIIEELGRKPELLKQVAALLRIDKQRLQEYMEGSEKHSSDAHIVSESETDTEEETEIN